MATLSMFRASEGTERENTSYVNFQAIMQQERSIVPQFIQFPY